MRLIDVEWLIHRIDEAKNFEDAIEPYDIYSEGYWDALDNVLSFIDQAPTIPQWHRCEAEMPSDSGDYLVYDGFSVPKISFYRKRFGNFSEVYSFEKPLYWMPLPELPKEAEE